MPARRAAADRERPVAVAPRCPSRPPAQRHRDAARRARARGRRRPGRAAGVRRGLAALLRAARLRARERGGVPLAVAAHPGRGLPGRPALGVRAVDDRDVRLLRALLGAGLRRAPRPRRLTGATESLRAATGAVDGERRRSAVSWRGAVIGSPPLLGHRSPPAVPWWHRRPGRWPRLSFPEPPGRPPGGRWRWPGPGA